MLNPYCSARVPVTLFSQDVSSPISLHRSNGISAYGRGTRPWTPRCGLRQGPVECGTCFTGVNLLRPKIRECRLDDSATSFLRHSSELSRRI